MADDWSSLGVRVPRDDDWSSLGRTVTPLNRGMGERAADNIGDGFRRSHLGNILRSADPGADGLLDLRDLSKVRPGSPVDWALDHTVGRDREWFAADDSVPGVGAVMTGRGMRGTEVAKQEDARRERYSERAGQDPIRNPGDAAAYFAGQVIGGAPSPENWIGGGAGKGMTGLGRVVARAGEQGVIAAAADVGAQTSDMGAGIEQRYDPRQTALAFGVGAVIQGAVDGAPHIPGARQAAGAVGDWSSLGRRVITEQASRATANPIPSFDGPAMDSGPVAQSFSPPVAGRVTSGFGPRNRPNARASANHQGIDYAAAEGTPVAASADGEVIFAGRRGNYGNRIEVRHADGTVTAYSHLSGFDARVGDRVSSGQAIARSGSTGNVTGPHVHFEALRDGVRIDPRGILDGSAAAARADGPAPLASSAEAPRRQFDITSPLATPETGALPTALEQRFPNLTEEQRSVIRQAVSDPSRHEEVRDFFTPTTASRREARNLSRVAINVARQEPAPTPTPAPSVDAGQRLASPADGAPAFRAEDTPDGFRVFEQGRLQNTPMLWGQRQGNDLRIESAALPPEMRGQGRGIEVYERAAEAGTANGGRMVSDGIVSGDAARMYEALGRRGYQVVRDPSAVEARGGWETTDGRPVYAVSREAGSPFARPEGDWSHLGQKAARDGDWSSLGSRVEPERLAIDMSAYGDRIGQTMPSNGQTVGGLREAPRPGAVERGKGADYAGNTVSQLADDLRAALGLTHRQGRVSMQRAAGEYDTGSGVIRTKAVDELDVLAHEATHAMEFERQGPALTAALKAHAAHLKTMAYPGAPANVARQEGFAEFGRWYLTNPDHARRIAPDFFEAFEDALTRDAPDVLAKMQEIQAGYRNLLDSASIDVAKASIAYTGSKGPIGDLVDEVKRRGVGSTITRLMDDAYTAFVDDLHPLSVAVRKLSEIYAENSGKKLELKRAYDPYALARLSREAYAAGHGDVMHGVTPYQGLDPTGPSLADAMETAGLDKTWSGKVKSDALQEFDAYLIARRMIHEWDRYARGDLPNPPDRNTKQFHQQVIADAEAAHPTWQEASTQVYGWLENLWAKEHAAGLITEASYKNGLTEHPDYVPLMRDMSDKGPGRAGKPRGALQFAGGVKAFEGSSRDIISPLSTMMRRAYELNAIIKRNDVLKALDDLGQKAGRGAGAIVERLPANQIEAITVQAADALAKTADELGLSGRDLSTIQKLSDDAASQNAEITLFKQSEFSPRKGEAVVFVWRDGKKTPLLLADGEFGQAMFTALAGMNKDLKNVVVDAMSAATQLLRYGVTLSPEFMAANLIRDQIATWINTDVGFVPVLDTIRGAISEVRQDVNALRYATVGGMRGGANVAATSKPFPKTDAEAMAQLQHLRRKGWKVKRFASWRGLAEATDLSETATRMAVYRRAFDKAKREGLNDYEAMVESGFTSRDYLDFGRRGSRMLSASRVVTFLNAALQGLDKTTRVLTAGGNLHRVLMPLTKEARTPAEKAALQHAYKAWAKVSALGALGLGLRMLYADDPEYQEIGDQLRATNWVFKAGGHWVFVPKPFELATISNILERGFEGTVLKDPTAGRRLLSDLQHTIAPPHEIPALSVPFAIGANRDHLGRPIVTDHLRGAVDPQLQFNAYTSDLGKLIGKVFKVSPAVVDYVVTGYGGSLGRYALQAGNLVGEAVTGRPRTESGPEDMFLARRFVRDITRGSTSQAEFWKQVSRDGGKLTTAEGSFRALVKDGRDAESVAYLNRLTPNARAFVTLKVFGGDGESLIHPLVRAQKALSVISDFRTDARDGELRDGTGAVIPLSPHDRRIIDDALSSFAQAEMRNALVASQTRGWAQKGTMDGSVATDRIGRVSPAALAELTARLELGKAPTVLSPKSNRALDAAWAQIQPGLARPVDAARFVGAVRAKRGESGDRLSRYQEAQRVAGGAYAPTAAMDFSSRAR